MAVVEYACQNDGCEGERVEQTTMSFEGIEVPLDVPLCPKCGNRMVWAPTSMNFALKGGGWTPKGRQ